MTHRAILRVALLAGLALGQLSCATTGLTPLSRSQPAERIGLAPEYRVFYDALQDYGDWVFVPELHYVFRPRESFVTWRPYEDGYWAPSDLYGWVWVSGEPFGWATYHYGRWFYDRYNGWVWAPGIDWGPAWVAWGANDQYAAWSPLLSPSPAEDAIPGGAWTYAPLGALGETNLPAQIVHADNPVVKAVAVLPVQNIVQVKGVAINRGPQFELVERHTGKLPRIRIEERELGVTPAAPAARVTGRGGAADAQDAALDAMAASRREAEEAARAAKALAERGGAPPQTVTVLKPTMVPGTDAHPHRRGEELARAKAEARAKRKAQGHGPGGAKPAPPDSTKR